MYSWRRNGDYRDSWVEKSVGQDGEDLVPGREGMVIVYVKVGWPITGKCFAYGTVLKEEREKKTEIKKTKKLSKGYEIRQAMSRGGTGESPGRFK